jgi:hypothetical protein
VAKSLPPALLTEFNGSSRSGKTSFQFFSSGFLGSKRITLLLGAFLFVSIKNLSPTLSTTPNESSPTSAMMGVKTFSFLLKSRKNKASPLLPLPRSLILRIKNLSSSVVKAK